MQFKHTNELFVLVNLYAPNNDSPNFFVEIINRMMDLDGKKLLIGDYNLIFNNDLDRTQKMEGRICNNTKSKETLERFMEDAMLMDVW